MILLDTCALLWWTLAPHKLSAKAKAAISAYDTITTDEEAILVSSISIWEIAVKCKKGKLSLGMSAEEFCENVKRINALKIIPIDENLWLSSMALDWEHRDHVDRVIVATAMGLKIPLLTSDESIRSFYKKVVW